MTPLAYCRRKVLAAKTSFFLPMLLVGDPERRAAMFALYAFCREVDDVVDSGLPAQEAKQRLLEWRRELDRSARGDPRHPVTRLLTPGCHRFAIPFALLHEIVDGMEMDLVPAPFADFPQLAGYCHKVAVAVGLVTLRILGLPGERADALSLHLGMAFQLTNILRDIQEDAQLGRLYLPCDLLRQTGVRPSSLLSPTLTPPLARALAILAHAAREHYRQGFALLAQEPDPVLFPTFVMARIYHAYLLRIEALGFDVFSRRIRFSMARKLYLAARAWGAWRGFPA